MAKNFPIKISEYDPCSKTGAVIKDMVMHLDMAGIDEDEIKLLAVEAWRSRMELQLATPLNFYPILSRDKN